VVVQNIAIVAEKLPVIGSAAVLMLQLIELCDSYRCNKTLFLALKARMQFMYSLYFAEGGKICLFPVLLLSRLIFMLICALLVGRHR
jgi:hypothetical protein